MQEKAILQEKIKQIEIKTIQRTILKLISFYKSNKISQQEFLEKLEKLKAKLIDLKLQLEKLENEKNEKEKLSDLEYFILEHLNLNEHKETLKVFKEILKKKYMFTFCDSQFEKLKEILKEIEDGNFYLANEFCKNNRNHFKGSVRDLEKQLLELQFVKLAETDKSKAIEFARTKFTNADFENKDYLINLLDNIKDDELDKINTQLQKNVSKLFTETYLQFYGLEDRLRKIVSFGLIAYGTTQCNTNLICPGCAYKVFSVMINRPENSQILCEGDGIVLDESNMAYCDSRGKVYGKKYLERNNVVLKDPKICYFV